MHGIRAFEGFDGDSAILRELCADPVIPFCSGIFSVLDHIHTIFPVACLSRGVVVRESANTARPRSHTPERLHTAVTSVLAQIEQSAQRILVRIRA